jgi:hypothetical protein
MDFKGGETEAEDSDARGRIAALEQKANQHSDVIAILQNKSLSSPQILRVL